MTVIKHTNLHGISATLRKAGLSELAEQYEEAVAYQNKIMDSDESIPNYEERPQFIKDKLAAAHRAELRANDWIWANRRREI